MLCRSTSTGVLSRLLPTVSHLHSGFSETEWSSSDVYQHQHHAQVATPRSTHLPSPASQYLKPATADGTRCTDGGDRDQFKPRCRKVQSENDLQSLWRTSSGSAATFAAAGSFQSCASQGYGDDFEFVGTLERLASERESALLEMSENSEDTPAGSEVSEELSEMLSMVNGRNFSNEKSRTMIRRTFGQFGQQESASMGSSEDFMTSEDMDSAPSCSPRGFSCRESMHTMTAEGSLRTNDAATRHSVRFDESTLHSSGSQETLNTSRGPFTLEAPLGKVFERSGYTSVSHNEIRGSMLITDLGFGNGSGGGGRGVSGGGGGGNGGGYGDSNGVEAQYRRMLEADPGHPLLLRNYARFLHEVKRDPLKAEPYYERAILANPGDGEVLGQYAQLIWEVYKDEDRAGGYFDQALQACPDDCYLNAAYASFLWSSEGNENDVLESLEEAHSSSGYVHNVPPIYGAAAVSA